MGATTARRTKACAICADLQRRRTEAREAGDLSKVTDLNVLMRRHQQATHS